MPNSTLFACITLNEIIWTRRDGCYGGAEHILKGIMERDFRLNPSVENFISIINDNTHVYEDTICEDCPDFKKKPWNHGIDDINNINCPPHYISESIVIFNLTHSTITLESDNPHLIGETIDPLSVWWN